jgi:uncharacterized protein involved in exopolysaccharide biosynthesis
MIEQPEIPVLDTLRHELAEKARQLAELEVMLADYLAERAQLIRDLRWLQTQIRDVLEQLEADLDSSPGP